MAGIWQVFGGSDELVLSVCKDELPGLSMPSKLARFMSSLKHDEVSLIATESVAKGFQAMVEDNSFCNRARLLCHKSQIAKIDGRVKFYYKRGKLLDIVQDGLVTGNCGKTALREEVEGMQLHSNVFRVKEINTVRQKLLFPDFHDSRVAGNVSFLPHKIAQNVPFNSQQLMSLVEALHILPTGSDLLIKLMVIALEMCEAPPSSIETKSCVISLESMAKFVYSVLDGSTHNVGLVDDIVSTTKLSNHVVTVKGAKLISPSSVKHVACHNLLFPFRVYYCHYVKSTNMYLVSLKNEKSGVEQSVVAECHMDTKPYPP
ncbi:BURP domain protein RD22-like [Cryptomeria japonica]|uniref:BURP domain protein RD22-like n=1 Tax=Cryptomeria japonica TaxID=3369 RepID=UPI0027DA51E6|nr:BURP domain protein RD22-like [Cryptomeria japonica]